MSDKKQILIIDDEKEMLSGCSKILSAQGYSPVTCDKPEDALNLLHNTNYDVIICDLRMPGIDGLEFLEKAKAIAPETPVIIFSAYGTISRVVEAMQKGAFDFIEKPFDADQLQLSIEKGLRQRDLYLERRSLLNQLGEKYSFDNIVGRSQVMQKVFDLVDKVSASDINVLITGESGTGKELIARCIHARSNRKTKAFVPVNCGALPENLFEAELFGFEKGAFTGANRNKTGLLEFADKGTFFLDEIGELVLPLQTKLLRVLQEGQLRPVGSNEIRNVDVRIISATNKNLKSMLDEKRIREDLFYRLNVVNIHLPPLRDRIEDIPLLSEFFLRKYLKKSSKNIEGFDRDVNILFEKFDWPGNVRQLENVVERAVTLASGSMISVTDLPDEFSEENGPIAFEGTNSATETKKKVVSRIETDYLQALLVKYRGKIIDVAKEAGMTRRNVYKLLHRYQLNPDDYRKKD